MNWLQIIWWLATNAPELWKLIKELLDLLERQGDSNATVQGGTSASLCSPYCKDSKTKVSVRMSMKADSK